MFGTLGVGMTHNFSLEGELGYRTNSFEAFWGMVDINQTTLMVNGVFDVPLSDSALLSLGAGAGLNSIELELPWISDDDLEAAAQVKAGFNFAVTEHMDVTASLRYLTTFASDNSYRDVRNMTVTIGIRFDL